MLTLEGEAKDVAERLSKLDRPTQMAVVESIMGDHSVCKSFLAATGRLEAPKEEADPFLDLSLSPSGEPRDYNPPRVEYVLGPPPTPVLRPLKQALVDTERYPKDGSITRVILFADNKKFADGTEKTSAHTNMTQSGQLGFPLLYDLHWLELHMDGDPEDCKRLLPHTSLTFFFGCNTPWLRIPAGAWRPIITAPGERLKWRSVKKIADAFKARGCFFGHYWFRIGSFPKARRIDSTESFRVDLEFSGGIQTSRDVEFKVCLQDTLYAQL